VIVSMRVITTASTATNNNNDNYDDGRQGLVLSAVAAN
jgi:hypothetical protein